MPILSLPSLFRHKSLATLAGCRSGCLRATIALGSSCALLALLATAALRPVAARGGDEQDQRGRIRSEVTLVSLLASVLDKNGRPALGLTADQFEVYEEGAKQKIEVFEPETQQPLDLALMIDSSLSEIKELEFEEDAASRFIQKLVRPADRLSVYEFADAVTQLAPFSSNVPSLQAALRRIVPGDGTALYDAIFLGSQGLTKNPAGRRRAIVLVTDAGETTSRADFETARRAALRADSLLYTIVVRAVKNEGGRNTAGEHALETICRLDRRRDLFPGHPRTTRRYVRPHRPGTSHAVPHRLLSRSAAACGHVPHARSPREMRMQGAQQEGVLFGGAAGVRRA